jgi:hypothetical protein
MGLCLGMCFEVRWEGGLVGRKVDCINLGV